MLKYDPRREEMLAEVNGIRQRAGLPALSMAEAFPEAVPVRMQLDHREVELVHRNHGAGRAIGKTAQVIENGPSVPMMGHHNRRNSVYSTPVSYPDEERRYGRSWVVRDVTPPSGASPLDCRLRESETEIANLKMEIARLKAATGVQTPPVATPVAPAQQADNYERMRREWEYGAYADAKAVARKNGWSIG
jgi:hypothetical protein